MVSLPVLKPQEVIRALLRAGFYVHHQTGSHARLLHTTNPELRVTVPIHSNEENILFLSAVSAWGSPFGFVAFIAL